MDDIDKMIINMLQENARASISEISDMVSLSIPAVSSRIKKLEESGTIRRYSAIIDPKAMNKNLEAVIMASCNSEREEEFKNYLVTESDIRECVLLTGCFDYCIKVFTENTQTLEGLMSRLKDMGASKLDVSVVLSPIVNKPTLKIA